MPYNILALNPGHNSSVALVQDGQLTYYCEEERLSRMKYDGNPFRAMLACLETYKVDELVIGGTSSDLARLPWTQEDAYSALARKFNPAIKITNMGDQHHLGHAAAAFYNSGFDRALAVIIDGAGSFRSIDASTGGFETESVYICEYPAKFQAVYKRYADGKTAYNRNDAEEFDSSVTITKAYEAVSQYLGFGFIEAGKTMGLAPYGKANPTIPEFFINGRGNKNLLIPRYPAGALIDENGFPQLRRTQEPSTWHRDFDRVTDIDRDLAWRVQTETQEMVASLIESAVNATGIRNVVIAGGYGLNVVANYYYLQRLPDVNIYVDPISNDGGTAIGLAKLAHHANTGDQTVMPLDTLYLGTSAPCFRTEYHDIIKETPVKTRMVWPADVAELLACKNIVAMFQGRSEAGPRALGNRSILFDPRATDGKDIVNRVKGREWFRPFAASVMAEHANTWFDMRSLRSSPFMMYAVNVSAKYLGSVPAVTHVDGTCRVQTVSEQDNKYYHDLISAFYAVTGVPMLFNTSFNLAGEPLVDSFSDAMDTFLRSDIPYLYLPEINTLIEKR